MRSPIDEPQASTDDRPSFVYELISMVEMCFGLVVLLFTVFFGIGLAGLFGLNEELGRNVPRWPEWMRLVVVPAWLSVLTFGLLSLRAFGGRRVGPPEHPLVLYFALARRPHRLAPIRWIVGLWWWALAAAVLAFTVFYATRDPNNGRGPGLVMLAVHMVPHFGASVAINGCVLIGLYHLTHSERITRAASRVRLLIDLAAVVVMMTIDVTAYRVP